MLRQCFCKLDDSRSTCCQYKHAVTNQCNSFLRDQLFVIMRINTIGLKRDVMQSSKKVVALTIAEKINSLQKIKIAGIEELDAMITDMDPGDNIFDAYRQKGVEIL